MNGSLATINITPAKRKYPSAKFPETRQMPPKRKSGALPLSHASFDSHAIRNKTPDLNHNDHSL